MQNVAQTVFRIVLGEVFAPDLTEVYLNDKQLLVSNQKTTNGLDSMVFDTIDDFDPPMGEFSMLSGQEGAPNRSGKYTHDYTIQVGLEGYKPEVVITPPAGSILEYHASEATPTEDPLIWNVRVSVKSPPGQEVTEQPTINFYAVPVGIGDNPEQNQNFSLGKVISTGYGTDITYKLNTPTTIKADVYDLNGKHVQNLSNGQQNSGENKLHWDSYNNAAGVYIIRIQPQGQEPQSLKVMKR